jgi:hypothetical protein
MAERRQKSHAKHRLRSDNQERVQEVLDHHVVALRLITEPDRKKAIRLLDAERSKYLKCNPIRAVLYGRPLPKDRGRPKQTVHAQSLGIFLAVDSGMPKIEILRSLGRDPGLEGNRSAQYRWIDLRIAAGRQTFLTRTPSEQSSIKAFVQAMQPDQLLKWLQTLTAS